MLWVKMETQKFNVTKCVLLTKKNLKKTILKEVSTRIKRGAKALTAVLRDNHCMEWILVRAIILQYTVASRVDISIQHYYY